MFTGNNGMVQAVAKRSILVEARVKGCAQSIRMQGVLHVPDLHSNLLSVSKLILRGLKVHVNTLGCVVKANNNEMLVVESLGQLDANVVNEAVTNSLTHSEAISHPLELWYKRTGHLNDKSMKSRQTMVSGMDVETVSTNVHSCACKGGIQNMQARRPFDTKGGARATKILEPVHSDLCGRIKMPSIGGLR